MRTLVPILFVFLAACSSGPGKACDPCAEAEANPCAGPGGQAAAAAASGGQRANNAPFAEDTARLAPQTTVGRGAGATTSSSADNEERQVASGGAQNIGLLVPTSALASNQGGGVSPAVAEAAKTVAAARRAYSMAVLDPSCTDARLEALAAAVVTAQEMLNAATAANRSDVITHYHMGGDNVLVGVSSSGTGGKIIPPEATKALAEAASEIATSESSFPPPAPQPEGDGE